MTQSSLQGVTKGDVKMRTAKVLLVLFLLFGAVHSRVFAFPASAPAPVVTDVSPGEAYSYQETTITISGANFGSTPIVRLNNASLPNVTFINSTTLTATVPTNLPGGAYTLTVTNPDGQSASWANAFNIILSTDGSVGNWQLMNSMTTERFCLAAVVTHGNLYALGGYSDATVERAVINPDGTLGTWQAATSMPEPTACSPAVTVGNYIYVFRGGDVLWTQVNPDGTLGTWQTLSMSVGGMGAAAAIWNNYVYVLGGWGNSNTAQRVYINPDGTLGAWETMNPMTTSRAFFGAVATAGYLYAFGGYDGSNGLSSVERAAINPDGTLGTWEVTGSMSAARFHHAVIMSQGYVYILGGYIVDNGWNVSSTGERVVINPDGTLGAWSTIPSMGVRRGDLGIAIAERYLYVLGGFDENPWVTHKSVERATLLFDFTPPTASSLTINGIALDTTSTNVAVALSATDPESGVTDVSLSNDGSTWSDWQTYAPIVNWTLAGGEGVKTVWGRVRNRVKQISQVVSDTIVLDTSAPPDHGVSINDGALFTNQITVTLTIGAAPGTAQMQVSNDGGFAGAQWEAYTTHKVWTITQYGNYVIPRVVYVRYKDASGNMSATFSDDIILDVTPPTGSVTIVGSAGSRMRRANTTVTLALSATDDVSGVGWMMLSNQSDFAGASWQAFATSTTWTLDSNNTVYVRFKDYAGNVSQTYSASAETKLYLPIIMR